MGMKITFFRLFLVLSFFAFNAGLVAAQGIQDNDPPNVSFIQPFSGNFSGELLFFASVEDGGSGVKSVEFGYALLGDRITWLQAEDSGSTYWLGSFNTSTVGDGPYNISVRATDVAGNQNRSLNVAMLIFDNNDPFVNLLSPENATNVSGIIALSALAVDDGTGVEFVEFVYGLSGGVNRRISADKGPSGRWNASLDTSALNDGTYELFATGVDFLGMEGNSSSVIFSVDNTPPEVSLTAPAVGDYSGVLGFSATSSDDLSGVVLVEFGYGSSGGETGWISGHETESGVWNGSLNTADVPDGSYYVSVRSTDLTGNQKVLMNVILVVFDNEGPSVEILSPADGGSAGGVFELSALSEDAGVGISRVEFVYGPDGTVPDTVIPASQSQDGSWSGVLNTLNLAEGAYRLVVESVDLLGQRNSDSVRFFVDNTPPQVSLTAPGEGNYSGILKLSARANDGRSSVEVDFGYSRSGDAVEWFNGTKARNGVWTGSLNTSKLSDGEYNLSVRATDSAGNENVSMDVVEILSDNTLPDVFLIDPIEGNYIGILNFSAVASDGLSRVRSVQFGYSRRGGSVVWFDAREDDGLWKTLFDTRKARDGSYNLSARATDFAGNVRTESDILEISIDNPDTGGRSSRRSSSGGGGGSSRTTTSAATPGNSQSQFWGSIPAGSTTFFRINKSAIPVSLVKFTVTEELKNARLTITAHNQTPSGLPGVYDGTIYRYLAITPSGINGSSVSSVVITFSVNASVLSENDASPDQVVLLRYDGSRWIALETRSTGSGNQDHYYEAESYGLSAHAIAMRNQAEAEEVPVQFPVVTIGSDGGPANESGNNSTVESGQPAEPVEPKGTGSTEVQQNSEAAGSGIGNAIYLVIGGSAIAMLAGAIIMIYVMRRNQVPDTWDDSGMPEKFEKVPDDITFESFEDPYDLDRNLENKNKPA